MKTANLPTKENLRRRYLLLRQEISRKVQINLPDKGDFVLSYCNISSELPTEELNKQLIQENKLVLPKVEKDNLILYKVESYNQLKRSSWNIPEPIPSLCQQIAPENISLALIPALAFDKQNNRLGYGKGFYDRLLPLLSLACGIGYKEQLHPAPLPTTEYDIALDNLLLF